MVNNIIKRLLDIIIAVIGLAVTAPLLIAMACWIKISSAGPVFYRGVRMGRHKLPFKIFKFRSMRIDADKAGPSSTGNSDSRITAAGQFIRRWKLDELAQLINVLKGDMSLVGPRPQVVEYVEKVFSENEIKIFEIRPGITDWASIWNADEGAVLEGIDLADEVYTEVIHPYKMKLQLYYLENMGIFLDLKIILFTLIRIFSSGATPREIQTYPKQFELRTMALENYDKIKNSLLIRGATNG